MRRPNASTVVFVVIALAAIAWIGSGMLARDAPGPPVADDRSAPVVAATWSEAHPVERRLTLYGEIVPYQQVRVRAQTAGEIVRVLAQRGAAVSPGTPIAQLGIGDRDARLKQAQAAVATARQELDAAQRLAREGFVADARVQAAGAELQAANAALATMRVEIENTVVRAPVAAFVNRLLAEVGDYVPVGGEVAELVDNDPLLAVVQVPQHAIARIRTGGVARVSIAGRAPLEGQIRFVAPLADAATRTFRVEIALPNPERDLPAGFSAQVEIPTETVLAHRVSPAIVSLDERGVPGLMSVGDDSTVAFHPIELVRADADGVWVTGLPQRARLITIRPGFVTPGQRVDVRDTPPGYDAVLTPAKA